MENGDNTFEQIQALIQKNDTDVTLKMGLILIGKQGSLIALRDVIQKYLGSCGGLLVYHQFTSQPLYLVHYNDLSPQKQSAIGCQRKE